MVTRTTEEAMDLLNGKRRELIDNGIAAAIWWCTTHGTVTSRDVVRLLREYGFLDDSSIGDYWVGAVFNRNPHFEWTGSWHQYSEPGRNIHERTVKVWRLK